jgi:hypothetical protein
MLSSLVAAGRQSNAAIARLCTRGLSASAISATDALQTKDSAFLRFGNPVPVDVGMSQHLPSLPETKVRRLNGWLVWIRPGMKLSEWIRAFVVRASRPSRAGRV